jgi:hypothetical protein
MEIIATIGFIALLNERLIEMVYAPIKQDAPDIAAKYKWLIRPLSFLFGVGLAMAFGVNLFANFSNVSSPYIGQIVTGLIVGGGSQFVSEVMGWFKAK